MLRSVLMCLTLLLAACAPGATGGRIDSPETGLSGAYTRQVVISDDPHHVLLGQILIGRQAGEVSRALIVTQRRDGVHRVRMRTAWSGGRAIPFRPLPVWQGCAGGPCRDNGVGLIPLTPALVAEAARSGFGARLLGREGPIDIFVPPTLWAEALALESGP